MNVSEPSPSEQIAFLSADLSKAKIKSENTKAMRARIILYDSKVPVKRERARNTHSLREWERQN